MDKRRISAERMDDRRIDGIDPDQVLAQRLLYRSEWPSSARLETGTRSRS